jgi:hypothetical protein
VSRVASLVTRRQCPHLHICSPKTPQPLSFKELPPLSACSCSNPPHNPH